MSTAAPQPTWIEFTITNDGADVFVNVRGSRGEQLARRDLGGPPMDVRWGCCRLHRRSVDVQRVRQSLAGGPQEQGTVEERKATGAEFGSIRRCATIVYTLEGTTHGPQDRKILT